MTDWLAYVESADTTEGARRVLLEYARGHRGGRLMSRPRREVAEALGISERAVSKHLKRAREDGLYVVVSPGQQGRTAVYEGTFGVAEREGSFYAGTAGTIEGVPAGFPLRVPAAVPRALGGSHQYYVSTEQGVTASDERRSDLVSSTFTGDEREPEVTFSLFRDNNDGASTCEACGAGIDNTPDVPDFVIEGTAEREGEVG